MLAAKDFFTTAPIASTSGRSHAQALIAARPSLRSAKDFAPARRQYTSLCWATLTETVNEELEGESLEQWSTCVERVKSLGFEPENAETIVGQAFGWGRQAYWLNKKDKQVPDSTQVNAVLDYLEGELKITGDDLQKVVKKFPEVINCSIEGRLKANLQHMQKAYYMKEDAAIKTVKRRPEVLGFTYDCEGSCEGLCNQCWVRL